ncbi:hypothetical protein Q4S45_05930 [Massilia sp. R2A-15]|uniref:hypothetical protein n=1 Tax=Massilia sp. R2A-15 TaxID=3064278 RepID=UPI0027348842|nr:hypothetical protein [Massilia sp. R2A-15]WLI90657.1 hypothetical protein Q4S45_05930 [Massilia sp. R2A-15]
MNTPNRLESRLVFLAFFCALFLFFTPFEQGGPRPSMVPKYLAAGASLALLFPLAVMRPVRLRPPSIYVLIMLLLIVAHAAVIISGPGQFALLILADMSAAIIMYEASFHWRREFQAAIGWLLFFNVLFIGLQAVLFYGTSAGMVDFHKMLFGSDSRFSEDYLNITRFAGFQVEPGTYANYIGCLLAILLLVSEFSERLVLLTCASIIGIFLTNSGSSVYFVPLVTVLGLCLWRKKVRAIHLVLLATAIATYLLASGIVTHLEERFVNQPSDGSLTHRIEGMSAYWATSAEEKFVGIGFVNDPCVRCSYQDIGVLFNLATRGGAAVSLVLLGMLARLVRVNGLVLGTLLVMVPFNEKMYFYEPSVWLFVLFALTGPGYVAQRSKAGAAPWSPAGTPASGGRMS